MNLYIFLLILYGGIHQSETGTCSFSELNGIITHEFVDSARNCCKVMGGFVFSNIKNDENIYDRLQCIEIMFEHEWLVPFPSLRSCVNNFVFWYSPPILNRRIQCVGRSYRRFPQEKSVYDLPSTENVVCFRHRYRDRDVDSNLAKCSFTSVHTKLAKTPEECCSERGAAAYYVMETCTGKTWSQLLNCIPCPNNSTENATWSEWSACPAHKMCTRQRSKQIPYLEKMPYQWCMETITDEENDTVKDIHEINTESGASATLIMAILSPLLFVIGLLSGILIFRYRMKKSSISAPAPSSMIENPKQDSYDDGYLVPNDINTNALPLARLTLPDIPEDHIYEGVDYNYLSMDGNPASYVEIF